MSWRFFSASAAPQIFSFRSRSSHLAAATPLSPRARAPHTRTYAADEPAVPPGATFSPVCLPCDSHDAKVYLTECTDITHRAECTSEWDKQLWGASTVTMHCGKCDTCKPVGGRSDDIDCTGCPWCEAEPAMAQTMCQNAVETSVYQSTGIATVVEAVGGEINPLLSPFYDPPLVSHCYAEEDKELRGCTVCDVGVDWTDPAVQCSRPLDIVLLLDESGSVSASEWEEGRQFIVRIAEALNGGVGSNGNVASTNRLGLAADQIRIPVVHWSAYDENSIGVPFIQCVSILLNAPRTTVWRTCTRACRMIVYVCFVYCMHALPSPQRFSPCRDVHCTSVPPSVLPSGVRHTTTSTCTSWR